MSQSVKLTDGSYIDASAVYDTTQGKTQEAVNADLKANVVRVRYSTTTASAAPYGWSVDITKSGYTPVMATVIHGWSGSVFGGIEGFTSTSVSGFASKGDMGMLVDVLYVKN